MKRFQNRIKKIFRIKYTKSSLIFNVYILALLTVSIGSTLKCLHLVNFVNYSDIKIFNHFTAYTSTVQLIFKLYWYFTRCIFCERNNGLKLDTKSNHYNKYWFAIRVNI